MSTNYTQNYSLCQWEPGDKVLRTDFNADNAKIDAALKGVQTTAEAAKAQAQAITSNAYTKTGYTPFVVGSYYGDNATTREISLGFKPKAVIVCPANGAVWSSGVFNSGNITVYGGMATENYSCGGGISVTNNGFQVSYRQYTAFTNASGCTYSYIAFR